MKLLKIFAGLCVITILSCSPTRKLQRALPHQIEDSPIFKKSFTGFALLNPENGEFIYEYQSDKYFTPASNTKIFTLYTCLQILEEKPAVLRYTEGQNAITIWGTGNPTLLHSGLEIENPTLDFLSKIDKTVLFSSGNFEDERYGPGWAWDDYPYYFQPEKSAFPIYGNVVRIEQDTLNSPLLVTPDYFEDKITSWISYRNSKATIIRKEFENKFIEILSNHAEKPFKVEDLNYLTHIQNGVFRTRQQLPVKLTPFTKEMPFISSDSLFVRLLSDTLKKEIEVHLEMPLKRRHKVLYGQKIFPIYQKMMIESDNFLAEQLLLMCADKQLGVLNSKKIIAYAKDSIFQDLPDELLWRDGSGLSRYNMFTPRTIARLLERIHQEMPEETVFSLFPAGGESGTLENWYGGKSEPYVFAKTGTLTGKHCLSGYVKTKTGKTLIFSFMHNNYKGSSRPLKEEMQRILEAIYVWY